MPHTIIRVLSCNEISGGNSSRYKIKQSSELWPAKLNEAGLEPISVGHDKAILDEGRIAFPHKPYAALPVYYRSCVWWDRLLAVPYAAAFTGRILSPVEP